MSFLRNRQLKKLERAANDAPEDAAAQLTFVRALAKEHPEAALRRQTVAEQQRWRAQQKQKAADGKRQLLPDAGTRAQREEGTSGGRAKKGYPTVCTRASSYTAVPQKQPETVPNAS